MKPNLQFSNSLLIEASVYVKNILQKVLRIFLILFWNEASAELQKHCEADRQLRACVLKINLNLTFCSISVSLQPFEYDPQEKNRHKFMVQAMFAPDGEINQDTLVRIDLSSCNISKTRPNIHYTVEPLKSQ